MALNMGIKTIVKGGFNWLKKVNPFLLLAVAFLISIILPGDYSVWNQLRYDKELVSQQTEIKQLKEKIANVNKAKEELHLESERLEKLARERYLMKEEDEDIYLIEE